MNTPAPDWTHLRRRFAGIAVALLLLASGTVGAADPDASPPPPPASDDTSAQPAPPPPETENPPDEGASSDASDSSLPADEKTPKVGDTVQLVFTSGDSAEGKIVQVRDDGYRVLIGGLEVTVDSSDLQDIIVLPSVEERFRQMRALIEPDDTESMSALADWAYARGLNTQALEVVTEALTHEPNDAKLRTLRDMLQAQIAMEKIKRQRQAKEAEGEATAGTPASDEEVARMPRPWPNFPLLTDDQVNLLKVYEVNLHHPPRIIIDRTTVDALLQNYASNPLIPTTREGRDAFRRRQPAEILDVMFRLGARELYHEVRVLGNPESMRAFRDYVQSGWLVNSCATNRCHGGEDAKDLVLFNRKPTSSRAVYTNFLILDRSRTRDGQPLIDYQTPDRSPLLQMGLPREEAITPHPDVPGWEPVFRSRDSRAFQRAVRWIQMMYEPRPKYPIDYTLPGGESEATPSPPQEPPVRR